MLLIKRKSVDNSTQSNKNIRKTTVAVSPTISPSSQENSKRHCFLSFRVPKKSRRQTKPKEELMDGIVSGTMNLSPSRSPSKPSISKLYFDDDSLPTTLTTSPYDSFSSIDTVPSTGTGSSNRGSPRRSSRTSSLRSSLMKSMNDTDLESLKLSISGLSLVHGSNITGNSPLVSPRGASRRNSVELAKWGSPSPDGTSRRHSTSTGAHLPCDSPITRSSSTRRRSATALSRSKGKSSTANDLCLTSPKTALRKNRVELAHKQPRRRHSIQSACNSSSNSSQIPSRIARRRSSILALSPSKDSCNPFLASPKVSLESSVEVCSPGTVQSPCNKSNNNSPTNKNTSRQPQSSLLSKTGPGILAPPPKDTNRDDIPTSTRRHSVTFASDFPLPIRERRNHDLASQSELASPLGTENKHKGYITAFLGPGTITTVNDEKAEEADAYNETETQQILEEGNHATHLRSSLIVDHLESEPHLNIQDLEAEGLFVW
jgi:hypothetical protein